MKRTTAYIIMIMALISVLVMPAITANANAPGPVRTLRIAGSNDSIRQVEYSGLDGNKPGHPHTTPAEIHHDVGRLVIRTDLITTTEIISNARAHALRQPGWGLCWKGRQTGVLFRKAKFKLLWCGSRRVSSVRYWQNVSGRWVLPPPITAALLQVRATGKIVLVTVNHTVSCAFSRTDKGWIPSNQLCSNGRTTTSKSYIYHNSFRVKAYKAQMNGWRDWVNRLTSRFHADVTLSAGDFNLDFKKFWVRKYLHSVWRSAGNPAFGWQTWSWRDYTHLMETYHGTYHVILDGVLASGNGVTIKHRSVSFPEMVSSDHSPVETVIGIPAS